MTKCNRCGYEKAVQGLSEIWCDKCDGKRVAPVDLRTVNPIVDRRDVFKRADADSYESKEKLANFLADELNAAYPKLHTSMSAAEGDDDWRVGVYARPHGETILYFRNRCLAVVADVAAIAVSAYTSHSCVDFRAAVYHALEAHYINR